MGRLTLAGLVGTILVLSSAAAAQEPAIVGVFRSGKIHGLPVLFISIGWLRIAGQAT